MTNFSMRHKSPMNLTRWHMLGFIAAMFIGTITAGQARGEEAVRLSEIEAVAQKLAEQAAERAKAEGWEVSPEKIKQAKQRIIRNLRKSFKSQKIAVLPIC